MSQGSARKRQSQSVREQRENAFLQVRARTILKQARKAIDGNAPNARELIRQFSSFIDRAAQRGGVHHRKAARLKSRLAIRMVQEGKS